MDRQDYIKHVEDSDRCESHEWSGQIPCDGPAEYAVTYVPEEHRGTATAAGSWYGLSSRIYVCAACAAQICEYDREWSRLVETADEVRKLITSEAPTLGEFAHDLARWAAYSPIAYVYQGTDLSEVRALWVGRRREALAAGVEALSAESDPDGSGRYRYHDDATRRDYLVGDDAIAEYGAGILDGHTPAELYSLWCSRHYAERVPIRYEIRDSDGCASWLRDGEAGDEDEIRDALETYASRLSSRDGYEIGDRITASWEQPGTLEYREIVHVLTAEDLGINEEDEDDAEVSDAR